MKRLVSDFESTVEFPVSLLLSLLEKEHYQAAKDLSGLIYHQVDKFKKSMIQLAVQDAVDVAGPTAAQPEVKDVQLASTEPG